MKYLILFSLLFCGCTVRANKPKEPKFYKDELVKYKVDPFYRKVCSGIGTVYGYKCYQYQLQCFYEITTEYGTGCPNLNNFPESDMVALPDSKDNK